MSRLLLWQKRDSGEDNNYKPRKRAFFVQSGTLYRYHFPSELSDYKYDKLYATVSIKRLQLISEALLSFSVVILSDSTRFKQGSVIAKLHLREVNQNLK